MLIRIIETVTGQPNLSALYWQIRHERITSGNIWHNTIFHLGLYATYNKCAFAQIPIKGSLVIVSNTLRRLDGSVLCYLVPKVRCDFKLLASATFQKVLESPSHIQLAHFDGVSTALR